MGADGVTTLIVDDEPAIRELARFIIETADEDVCVIGEATDGYEAVDAVDDLRPAVVLLDILMPGIDGLETASRILASRPDQRIILFSASMSDSQRRQAAELGVRACLDKLDFSDAPQLIQQVASAA